MAEPLDNAQITNLVVRYQRCPAGSDRDQLFSQIAELVVPLIQSTIYRFRWDSTLAESSHDLVNSVIVKLPAMLARWKPDNGTTFCSYFLSTMLNTFRHIYAKRQRRSRYHADWPIDETGSQIDIPDTDTQKLNGELTTILERGREFESLIFAIPSQLAKAVDPQFSGLVHYIAERVLMRVDNSQTLYFSALRAEVALLPEANSLTTKQIDALVRMTIAGVRARLHFLRANSRHTGSLDNNPGSAEPRPLGFLSLLPYRSWPLLLIFDQAQTQLLLDCLAGVHESVPPRPRWGRVAKASASQLFATTTAQ